MASISPNKKASLKSINEALSGWQDSNLRPPGPKPGAIPGYATSRTKKYLPLIFTLEANTLGMVNNTIRSVLRREWDSNPRYSVTRTTI
jgi:hypothetical protein